MKKAFFGIVITILFFFVGRNQPAITETISHKDEDQSTHANSVDKTNSETPEPQNQKAATEAAQAKDEPPPAPTLAPTLTFEEKLASLVDSELFEELYSDEFKSQWQASLPTLKQRLFSALPTQSNDQDFLEKEVTARLGILKALSRTEEENNEDLKEFLFSYIEFTNTQKDHPWLLQREAAHTLTQNNDLDEDEQQKVAQNLDPRARNTATRPDVELIERTIAGDE